MGILIDGKWQATPPNLNGPDGRFVRQDSSFRNWVTPDGSAGPTGQGGVQAEPGRYRLYVSLACPWAHRTLIFRVLKGLQEMIPVSVTHWLMAEEGWTFTPAEGVVADPVHRSHALHELYTRASPDYSGRATVPLLWDCKQDTIVSNESADIIRMFNRAFDDAGARGGDYYYNAMIGQRENVAIRQERREDGKVQTISGSGEATVATVRLLKASGEPVEVIDVGAPVSLVVEVNVNAPIPRLVLGYMIKDRIGQVVFGTNTHLKGQVMENLLPGQIVTYRFSFEMNLGPGSYSVATALVSSGTHMDNNYQWTELALVFTVMNMTRQQFIGSAWIDPEIEIQSGSGAAG